MELYRVMNTSNGFAEVDTDGWTREEAIERLGRLMDLFPDEEWWIDRYQAEEPKEGRNYNEDACDGYEDIYPL